MAQLQKYKFYRIKPTMSLTIRSHSGHPCHSHLPRRQTWVPTRIKLSEEASIAATHNRKSSQKLCDRTATYLIIKKMHRSCHSRRTSTKRCSKVKMPLGKWLTLKCSSTNHRKEKQRRRRHRLTISLKPWCNSMYQNWMSSHQLWCNSIYQNWTSSHHQFYKQLHQKLSSRHLCRVQV